MDDGMLLIHPPASLFGSAAHAVVERLEISTAACHCDIPRLSAPCDASGQKASQNAAYACGPGCDVPDWASSKAPAQANCHPTRYFIRIRADRQTSHRLSTATATVPLMKAQRKWLASWTNS
ncbi:unnamed protein product [Clonostachys byssicola]|uniref:Uncharacterized protein n=1 Tax=Clonostachys byssicola TaxID=160290 RepID=A0A9N9Y3A8_9HYPO|nr:unnamed protein product [Clonostachys byssicola]